MTTAFDLVRILVLYVSYLVGTSTGVGYCSLCECYYVLHGLEVLV